MRESDKDSEEAREMEREGETERERERETQDLVKADCLKFLPKALLRAALCLAVPDLITQGHEQTSGLLSGTVYGNNCSLETINACDTH